MIDLFYDLSCIFVIFSFGCLILAYALQALNE